MSLNGPLVERARQLAAAAKLIVPFAVPGPDADLQPPERRPRIPGTHRLLLDDGIDERVTWKHQVNRVVRPRRRLSSDNHSSMPGVGLVPEIIQHRRPVPEPFAQEARP